MIHPQENATNYKNTEVKPHNTLDAESENSDLDIHSNNLTHTTTAIETSETNQSTIKRKRPFLSYKNRKWFVLWLYAVAISHFVVGFLLASQSDHPLLNFYHQSVERFFWQLDTPEAARSQQVWWMSLFGATLQYLAILMLILIYTAQRYQYRMIWFGLILAFLIWLPQDSLISFQANQYIHIAINLFAAICILTPLIALFLIDKKGKVNKA